MAATAEPIAAALEGPGLGFATRPAAETRLCECAQSACPIQDYAAARCGHFRPLDLVEGRLPVGFPRPRSA